MHWKYSMKSLECLIIFENENILFSTLTIIGTVYSAWCSGYSKVMYVRYILSISVFWEGPGVTLQLCLQTLIIVFRATVTKI